MKSANDFNNQDSDMLSKIRGILEASGPGKVKGKEKDYEKLQKKQNDDFEDSKGKNADTTAYNNKTTELSKKGLDEAGFSSPLRSLDNGPVEKINTAAERTHARSLHSKINSRVGKYSFDSKNDNTSNPKDHETHYHNDKITKLSKNKDNVAQEIRKKAGITAKQKINLPEDALNELSNKTLKKYRDKAEDSQHETIMKAAAAKDTGNKPEVKKQEKKFDSRSSGIELASDKISRSRGSKKSMKESLDLVRSKMQRMFSKKD